MSQQRQRDTSPETQIRQSLHRAGLRFRVNVRVPSMPRRTVDVAFARARVAVFVDGCFWHGCREHKTLPKANACWWQEKIQKNRVRDAETTRALTDQGWLVLRYWEHEDAAVAVGEIIEAIRGRLPG